MPGVPRSTYYWMIEHPEAERVDPIAGDVRAVRRDGHERCGAGKIKAALERRGVVFCQIFVGRFGVSFSPFERLFLGRFGFGQSCGLSVIA